MKRGAGKGVQNQIGLQILEEGNSQIGLIGSARFQIQQAGCNGDAHEELQPQLDPNRQPQVPASLDLADVVGETDGAEPDHRTQSDPHQRIAEVGPKEGGHHRAGHDQDTSHGGRPSLDLVVTRTLLSDVLLHLELAQATNEPGAQNQGHYQRRNAGVSRPEGDVAKYIENRGVGENFEQPLV